MRERLYLSLLVGVLLCLAGWTAHAQLSRSNSARQAWEYKTILLSANELNLAWSSWSEDGRALPLPVDPVAKRAELGSQGWELVSVVTLSRAAGGGTTDMQQVFKRPK